VISESKQLVLQKLQESLSSKTFSDNVAYVGEHNFEESQASPYTQANAENSRNEEPKQERKEIKKGKEGREEGMKEGRKERK